MAGTQAAVWLSTICGIAAFLTLGLAASGCGDDARSPADAGLENARLVILSPPGDALGVSYGEQITLRVRYQTESGTPIAGEMVRFALRASQEGEDTAGSTLSATAVATDELGVARVSLAAGAQEAVFRVSVDARDAPTAYFYVSISEGGFARLYVTPRHDGWRPGEDFARVDVRLFRAETTTCATLDIESIPESLFPPRSLGGFTGTVDYQNVNAGQAYTLIAWAEGALSDTPLSVGCLDLDGAQLPSSEVRLNIVVRDRALRLMPAIAAATMDLTPVKSAIDSGPGSPGYPWHVLACPSGVGQLLLDCSLDAAEPDGLLDCVPQAAGPLAMALAGRRGVPDDSGCRLDDQSGGASLDLVLQMAATAGGFPAGEAWGLALATRDELLSSFVLESELAALPDGAAVRHRLRAARVTTTAGEHVVDLLASSRPLVEQARVEARFEGDVVVISRHEFTLRYGAFARDAFYELALRPAGLGEALGQLGQAMSTSLVDSESGLLGCAALSIMACSEAGRPASCLVTACEEAAEVLDSSLEAWWRALDTTGADLALSGRATMHDIDDDLTVDLLGRDATGAGTGSWSATVTFQGRTGQSEVLTAGTF